jgi:hypothetical protein
MIDGIALSVIAGTFLLAGTIKGIIGLGLPSISLAILIVAFDLPPAMTLLLLPSLASILWQAAKGGNGKVILTGTTADCSIQSI